MSQSDNRNVSESNSQDEVRTPSFTGKRFRENALSLGPRKKACHADPLVHHGRHFGRTIHALCNIQALITNGIVRLGELSDSRKEDLTFEERQEFRIFKLLLHMIPGLEERLLEGDAEETVSIAELIQKGASSARSDDTKSLKGVILDWITRKGESLNPPLARNMKTDRGFNHEKTGALLCPAGLDWSNTEIKSKLRNGEMLISGDQWPIFLYHGYRYDSEDPWQGLLRNSILISAYRHIFTSPSSVDREPRATRSGNARIHGMTRVTPASIAYVATQVRFALSSSPVFSRTDTVTDSERFYSTVLNLLGDPEEREEVNSLIVWWNRQIFPNHYSAHRLPSKDSALAKIKERRAALQRREELS